MKQRQMDTALSTSSKTLYCLTKAFCGLVELRNKDLWELIGREIEHQTRAIPGHHQNLTIISSINWNITLQSHESHMTTTQ